MVIFQGFSSLFKGKQIEIIMTLNFKKYQMNSNKKI